MKLTLNNSISDLILAMAEIIEQSDGDITIFDLNIPDQLIYLEIAIKQKEVIDD